MAGWKMMTNETHIDTGAIQILHNIIIWVDGTLRPWRGHNQCSGVWVYDGQFHVHKCPQPNGKKVK